MNVTVRKLIKMGIQKIIAGIAGLIFAYIGIVSGATTFAAICYTNAILLAIYMEVVSPKP